jgi:hypothetical protein
MKPRKQTAARAVAHELELARLTRSQRRHGAAPVIAFPERRKRSPLRFAIELVAGRGFALAQCDMHSRTGFRRRRNVPDHRLRRRGRRRLRRCRKGCRRRRQYALALIGRRVEPLPPRGTKRSRRMKMPGTAGVVHVTGRRAAAEQQRRSDTQKPRHPHSLTSRPTSPNMVANCRWRRELIVGFTRQFRLPRRRPNGPPQPTIR